MTFWDILEIEATYDKKIIKKAYATKLKQTQADENPKEFQKLNEAFNEALKYSEQEFLEEEYAVNQVLQGNLMEEELGSINEQIVIEPKKAEKIFAHEIYSVVQTYTTRLDIDAWRDICMQNEYWDYSTLIENQRVICQVLSRYFKTIPKSIILFLFEHFELLEVNTLLEDSDEVINKFVTQKQQIYAVPDFLFSNYSEILEEERDTYYENRYDFYYNLNIYLSDDFDFAEVLNKVGALQLDDVDYLNLLAQLYFYMDFPNNISDRKMKGYIKRALDIDETNPTTNFLYYYYQAMRSYKISRKGIKFLESNPKVNLEPNLEYCMSGFIYYQGLDRDGALRYWEQVDNKSISTAFQNELDLIRDEKKKEAERLKRSQEKEMERVERKKLQTKEKYTETGESLKKKSNKWLLILLFLILIFVGIKGCHYFEQIDDNKPNITEKEQKSINESIKKPKLDLDGR
ncbi:hypothetical protein QJV14_06550 [Listeria cossartiae subsp. cayugensis]|uniref:hypothetical protein n=1 Tax=Listeria cossartiae TaxID=2838249 RepID=UPI0028801F5A|nr:hypothetical protein [Listeria cossartiae]MDT0002027.1 hypothetical protein [Listeria cossartiae subsp. cayugensis]MDT0019604.1 hypothetical protein [Listeria cossartiae subsp. cayugensis]MDT0034822.1 hypothetical protein [Listeria cossartiae subsp. cayugensis]MDT0041355.1 hypothetical protein [Listeria cossartiae subsp. cayugensis]MDT0045524.1 hypothetical protein [Listeria cossartiae subsp. cayugensis]